MRRIILMGIVVVMLCMQLGIAMAAPSPAQVESAINWALSKVGKHEYSGLCLGFVTDAYAQAGVNVTRYYDAAAAGNALCTHTDRNPPRGALVFWVNGYNNHGHAALSLGDGTIVETNSKQGIRRINLYYDQPNYYNLKYRGWGYFGGGIPQDVPSSPEVRPSGKFRIISMDGAILYQTDSNALIVSGNRDIGSIWTAAHNANGSVSLFNQRNGLVMDVEYASNKMGANVIMHGRTAADNTAQLWHLYGSPSNFYMKAECNPYVLDFKAQQEGQTPYMWEYHGGGNQRFRIEQVVTYPVSVVGGSASRAEAEAGDQVILNASIPEGHRFLQWESTEVTITNSQSATDASFIMPAQSVNIQAVFTQPVTGIALSQAEATINMGETFQLIAKVSPENATNKIVAWHSSNEQVAKVDSNGLVTPVSPGSATIMAIAQDGSEITGSATITVNKMVYDMSAVAWDYQKPFVFDGTQKIVQLIGLPQGVIPAYAQNIAIDPGTYTAFVIFTYDEDNYEAPVVNNLEWEILPAESQDLPGDINDDPSDTIEDSIRIRSIRPDRFAEYEQPTTFTVTVDYALHSKPDGWVIVAFNSKKADDYTFEDPQGVAAVQKGKGSLTFTTTATPRAWGTPYSPSGAFQGSLEAMSGHLFGSYAVLVDDSRQVRLAYHKADINQGKASLIGDADDNGVLDIGDLVSMIDKLVSGIDPKSMKNADVNNNGEIDLEDLLYVLKQIV